MAVIFALWLPLLLELDLQNKIHVCNNTICTNYSSYFCFEAVVSAFGALGTWDNISTKPRNFFHPEF